MGKKQPRKSYSLDFKKKAVMMTTKDGVTVNDVADELGVPAQYLSQWRSKLLQAQDLEAAEKRLDALEENRRLKEELKQTKMELEILKNCRRRATRKPVMTETRCIGYLAPSGWERPFAFWWRKTPLKNLVQDVDAGLRLATPTGRSRLGK